MEFILTIWNFLFEVCVAYLSSHWDRTFHEVVQEFFWQPLHWVDDFFGEKIGSKKILKKSMKEKKIFPYVYI